MTCPQNTCLAGVFGLTMDDCDCWGCTKAREGVIVFDARCPKCGVVDCGWHHD